MSPAPPRTGPTGVWHPLGPNRVRVLSGVESGSPIGAVEYEVAPGFAPPPVLHRHTDADAGWLVLDGAIDVSFEDGATRRIVEGASITIPRHCWFRWANATADQAARCICWFAPAGFERFFPAAASAAADHLRAGGTAESFLPTLIALRAEFGDELHPGPHPAEAG